MTQSRETRTAPDIDHFPRTSKPLMEGGKQEEWAAFRGAREHGNVCDLGESVKSFSSGRAQQLMEVAMWMRLGWQSCLFYKKKVERSRISLLYRRVGTGIPGASQGKPKEKRRGQPGR